MSISQVEDGEGGPRVWPHPDPAIKLFGKDIPVSALSSNDLHQNGPALAPAPVPGKAMASAPAPSQQQINQNELPLAVKAEDSDPVATNTGCDAPISGTDLDGTSSSQGHGSAPVSMDISVVKGEDTPSHGKILKKPDKLLPCPRCESLDTKFCYFNNYNVNQPRHFCRKCQRYWTAGGMLRNVPVGAGRRKNKHSSSHHKNMAGAHSDAMTVRSDSNDIARHRSNTSSSGQEINHQSKLMYPGPRVHLHPLEACTMQNLDSQSPKTGLLTFGQESPLCRSMAATTIGIQKPENIHASQRFHSDEPMETNHLLAQEIPIQKNISISAPKGVTDHTVVADIPVSTGPFSAGSSMPTYPVVCKQTNAEMNASTDAQAKSSCIPYGAGPWQFNGNIPWSTEAGAFPVLPPNFMPCNGTMGTPPGLWPSFPWPLMNPAMWGAPPPLGWANTWAAMPWGSAAAVAVAGLAGAAQQPMHQTENPQPEGGPLVPKTLRIADPDDAARSSIWTTLGLGDGPSSTSMNAAKAFKMKSDSNDADDNSTAVKHHQNPAALSRSATFNENN